VKGRKRQLLVDSSGLPIRVVVQAANVQDKTGGKVVLRRLPWTPRLAEIRADRGYASPALAHWCQQVFGATLMLSQPDPERKGFVVQKGRWVVERTFAWLGRYRRLSKDYEQSLVISENFVYVASTHLLVRRFCRNL
jgi:putative transposase